MKLIILMLFAGCLIPKYSYGQNILTGPEYMAVPGNVYNTSLQSSDSSQSSCTEEKALWRAGLNPSDTIKIAVTKFDVGQIKKYIQGKGLEVRSYFCEGYDCGQLTYSTPSKLTPDILKMYNFFCAGKGKDVPGYIKIQLWERIPYSIFKRVASEVIVPLDQFVQRQQWSAPLMYDEVMVELTLIRNGSGSSK